MQVRDRGSVSTLAHAASRASLRGPQFTLDKFSVRCWQPQPRGRMLT